jgi:hypothetical protein
MPDDVSMAGASPALLTCRGHVGRNRFAYYTIDEQGGGTCLTILPTRTLFA